MSSTRNRHNIQLAAFYFPDYHCDERMEKEHGPGWTEWDVVQAARSRFQSRLCFRATPRL